MTTDADAFEHAIRRVLADDEVVRKFWQRGYLELTTHAESNASRWLGRRILTAAVIAITTAGLVWLVKTGALK
jgi:hypothetical protein